MEKIIRKLYPFQSECLVMGGLLLDVLFVFLLFYVGAVFLFSFGLGHGGRSSSIMSFAQPVG